MFTLDRIKLKCRTEVYNDVTWYTVEPKGGMFSQRQKWWADADTWATEHLGQGFTSNPIGKGSAWQLDCRWLLNNGKFWFRDQDDMLVFVLVATPQE